MRDEQFNRLFDKLDKIDEKVQRNTVVLAEQQVILDEHQRRSIANEAAVDILRVEIKPLLQWHSFATLALKVLGVLALLATIYRAVKH
jgi:hypothetical protein